MFDPKMTNFPSEGCPSNHSCTISDKASHVEHMIFDKLHVLQEDILREKIFHSSI